MKSLKAKIFLCVTVIAMQAMKFAWADINITREPQSEGDAIKLETDIHGSAVRALDSICQEMSLPTKISVKAITPIVVGALYRKAIYNDKNKVLAYITQNSATGTFAIWDLTNKMVLTGKTKATSTGDEIELFNCQNTKIGTIKRDTERSFLTAASSYDVKDDQGNLIFKSEKRDESSPLISVTDRNKAELASLLIKRNDKKFEATMTKEARGENALLLMATLKLYDDSNK